MNHQIIELQSLLKLNWRGLRCVVVDDDEVANSKVESNEFERQKNRSKLQVKALNENQNGEKLLQQGNLFHLQSRNEKSYWM